MKRHLCGMLLGLAAVFSAASASAQGGTWTTRAPMPTARSWAGAGVINDILYVVGGSYNGNGLSTVEAYDWTSNTWTAKAPMPTPRQELAVGVVNGILYAIGGSYSRQVLSTVEAYDPVSNTWTAKAPMPTPRVELAAGVVNGILYAIGGNQNNGNFLSTVEAYDPMSNSWTTKAPMPTARLGLAAGVVNGVLYAVGGYNSNGALSSFEAYDPATGTWTAKASMSSVRYEPGAGVVGGTLYAVGGADNSNNLILSIATVEAYDPASNSWTWQASMATAREALPVATVNGALYAVGGYSSSGNTGANEAFVPPDDDSRLAQLTGGNNFIGNQTINGVVNATSFSGDGSALTNLNPASLSSGTADINIRGNAATATQADTATNAASLGGRSASFYATTAANAFTGDQTIGASLNVSRATSTGSLTIGAGTAITQHLSLTVNPAFPALKAGACAAATFTFTGASDGDTTALGLPGTRMTGGGNLNYSAWVSAADKLTIQVCNVSVMPQKTAATGAIRVDVWKH